MQREEDEEESTVTSKSLALIRLLSSPRLSSGPLFPSINKSTAKNGTVVAIKPRYGRRGVPQLRSETERNDREGRKKKHWSCQFNLSSRERESTVGERDSFIDIETKIFKEID